MSTYHEILDAAQALPSAERARIIHSLWDTVSSDDWQPPSDAWLAEANQRANAIDGGEMTTAPWTEVRRRVRGEAGLDD